jgi:hypothetical protein
VRCGPQCLASSAQKKLECSTAPNYWPIGFKQVHERN